MCKLRLLPFIDYMSMYGLLVRSTVRVVPRAAVDVRNLCTTSSAFLLARNILRCMRVFCFSSSFHSGFFTVVNI